METIEFDSNFLDQLLRVIMLKHHDPHTILGLHPYFNGNKVIRLWRPGADKIYIEFKGSILEAKKIHKEGVFELIVPSDTKYSDYRIYHRDGSLTHDPYTFQPLFTDLDQYLFSQGVHYQLHQKLGARLLSHQGIEGTNFAVWAPNATNVSLVGDFNHWDGRVNPMRSLGASGIWELFVPGIREHARYKFEIHTMQGGVKIKADPFALSSEVRPATASIVANIHRFQWQDHTWMSQRKEKMEKPHPMNVYEVHLGSWKKNGNDFLNYREIAHELVQYCKDMNFTHVELMPIQEHPLDESWGYQVTGYFAPTSRFGTPEDFQYFVNHFHQNNLGVIIDWVPGHFPSDDYALGQFDGTALFEHADPRQGFHPHWNTFIFNFGRREVTNFLISNALYWFEEMHIDGLRVDAVASMLYLDYGRDESEWIPNAYGGKENIEAIEFLKHLNSVVHNHCPGVITIAEESTSFLGVTHPLDKGGLGFDLKWNMGWMNDTLRFFSKDMFYRHYHHNDLTFGLIYAFSEKFILVLSHDEVVHGKRNLISKMPGDMWQQFANLRLLISYMICQPAKKLLFMGSEIAQWNEWYCKEELEWFLLRYPSHHSIQTLVKEINRFYLDHPALWEKDFTYDTFQWVDFFDVQNSVISYLRKGNHEQLMCVHNFTPVYHDDYVIQIQGLQKIEEIFNSDTEKYGGSGKLNYHPQILRNQDGYCTAVRVKLAPLATMIFKIEY